MTEYIKREPLRMELFGLTIVDDAVAAYADAVLDRINTAPAADVAEVRHGSWELMQYEGGILDGTIVDRCSRCGWERVLSDVRLKVPFRFCPDCGAKMDEGDGDD